MISRIRQKLWRIRYDQTHSDERHNHLGNWWFPDEIYAESNDICDAIRFEGFSNSQEQSDFMNAALKALWQDNADKLGVPEGAECLVTPEFIDYLRYAFGWKTEYINRVKDAGYVIWEYGGGGGGHFILPDKTWIGAVEFDDMVKKMRYAWVEQHAPSN